MKPHVLAFYSYRGGVGRSTALCNVAARMAMEGDRVLVIDLDLQAPGASIILGGANYASSEIHGIVDEIKAAKSEKRRPDFSKCVRSMQLRGKPFWLLPAGRLDTSYPGNADDAEFAYISSDTTDFVQVVFGALQECTESDKYKFHYVLIDCRPGLSKASLYAAQYLAEGVVILFGLDKQSLHGVAWTREKFRELNKMVHLVASRTPVREDTRLALTEASKAWEDPVQVTLSFDESMLLRERLVLSSDNSQLARDYDVLTSIVRSPDDIASLVADGRRLLGESGGALTAHARFQRAHNIDRGDVRPLAALAHYYTVAKTYEEAIKYLTSAVEVDAEYGECWQVADALARESLESGLVAKLEALYQRIPANKQAGGSLIAKLALFSLQIREATKPGVEFSAEVAKAFLAAAEAAKEDSGVWQEFLRRIPLPENGGAIRQFIVNLTSACGQHSALVDASRQLKELLEKWSKDISGMVTRFGSEGFGFLATDDGQNDIYFRRSHCAGYGREAYEYISVGETALLDVRYASDGRWQAENVRFPIVEAEIAKHGLKADVPK